MRGRKTRGQPTVMAAAVACSARAADCLAAASGCSQAASRSRPGPRTLPLALVRIPPTGRGRRDDLAPRRPADGHNVFGRIPNKLKQTVILGLLVNDNRTFVAFAADPNDIAADNRGGAVDGGQRRRSGYRPVVGGA